VKSITSVFVRTRQDILKGEQIHGLARDSNYGKHGRISKRDIQEQRNSCNRLTLILASRVYWQAKEINRVVLECHPKESGIGLTLPEFHFSVLPQRHRDTESFFLERLFSVSLWQTGALEIFSISSRAETLRQILCGVSGGQGKKRPARGTPSARGREGRGKRAGGEQAAMTGPAMTDPRE
jgi:hypothetical protein